MYLATVRKTSTTAPRVPVRRVLVGNVLALGVVSLVTDVSSEMVTSVLGAYAFVQLGLGVVGVGLLDGFYQGATALSRLAGGYVADRLGALKAVAGTGYGLGALAKLVLLAVPSAAGVVGAIGIDRVGKGIRTAPRDAMISLVVEPEALGRAFGVHRAMDSAGAFLGPLVATGVLLAAGASTEYDAVFLVSLCVAVLGVLVLVLFAREPRRTAASNAAGRPDLRVVLRLLRDPAIARMQVAAVLLGLVTVGDTLVYLRLFLRQELSTTWYPLLAVATSVAFLLLAVPLGVLADRVGRWWVVVGGHVALAAVYVLLSSSRGGWLTIGATLALYGAFYAATEGVLVAAASAVLPVELRTSGIALLQTGQALAYLVSSVLFAVVWQWWGAGPAWLIAGLAVILLLPVIIRLLRPGRTA
ncbi:MFS transporter [Nocardioides sp. AN3]